MLHRTNYLVSVSYGGMGTISNVLHTGVWTLYVSSLHIVLRAVRSNESKCVADQLHTQAPQNKHTPIKGWGHYRSQLHV